MVSAAPAQSGDLLAFTDMQAELPANGKNTYTLTIYNRSGQVIDRITFKGSQTYVFTNVPRGRSKYEVVKGTYRVTYRTYCGENINVAARINGNYTLITPYCASSTIHFDNKTGAAFDLTMVGVKTYQVHVPEGKSKYVFLTGNYRFSATGTCGTRNGNLWICRSDALGVDV